MFPRIPFDKVNWLISSFLIGTLFLSLTAVPASIWFFGIDWFQTHRRLQAIAQQWTLRKSEQLEVTREMLTTLRNEVRTATRTLRRLGVRDPQAG